MPEELMNSDANASGAEQLTPPAGTPATIGLASLDEDALISDQPIETSNAELAGLVGTLNKFKKLGSLRSLEKKLSNLDRLEGIMTQLQAQNISVEDIPARIQAIEQAEQQQQQLQEEVQKAIAQVKTEYDLKERKYQEQIKLAQQQTLDQARKNQVQMTYLRHCREDFAGAFDDWYATNSKFLEFEDGSPSVKAVKKLDGTQYFVEGVDEVQPATLDDFFVAVGELQYGGYAAGPIKRLSEASGGGGFSTSNGTMSEAGTLRITRAQSQDPMFVSGLSTENQAKIRRREYQLID